MANHRIKGWTVRRTPRRVHGFWEIRNGRGTLGVWYGDESSAKKAAAAPRMLTELKHVEAILRMREGELRASEKATLARIRALIAEVSV